MNSPHLESPRANLMYAGNLPAIRWFFPFIPCLLIFCVPLQGEVRPQADQTSPFSHPVLERWKASAESSKTPKTESAAVREIMALTDAQVLGLIPEESPTINDSCPSCDLKNPNATLAQQEKQTWMEFDPQHPDQVKCKKCGVLLPSTEYPLNQTNTFRNMLGAEIPVGSYVSDKNRRTAKEKVEHKDHPIYLRGIVDSARKNWLLPRMQALAEIYQSTHDERYARRLILILDEFSKRYPGYLLTTDYGYRYVTTKGGHPPYGFIDTRWGRRSADDLPADLLELFDLAASSPSMDEATKKRIIAGLFMDPLKRAELTRDPGSYYGNECPLADVAEQALVLEDPDRVHAAYAVITNTPHFATPSEGIFNQSMGYGSLFRLTFFEGARVLDGYSDPKGYVGKDGLHLENIHPMKEMEEYFTRLDNAFDRLRLPSGGWLTYDDSGSGFGPTWWSGVGESCRPLDHSTNVLLPGLRRAVLGAGSGDKQIQVALDFAEHGVNHGHQSGLAMQIFAFGHSLVDDFPYHKSILRLYGAHTVSHPTVVIDYKNQEGRFTGGDVELYAPLMDGVSFIRADDRLAYDGLATRYTRSLLLNAIDPDMPYVVDIFEVAGGTNHDYLMRSSSLHHSSGSSSLATQPIEGERPLLPPGEQWVEPRLIGAPVGSGYGLFFDAKKAPITDPFHFTSECDKPWEIAGKSDGDKKSQMQGAWLAGADSWPDRPPIGIRHHVAVGTGYEFLDFSSPSLVEEGFHGEEGKTSDKWLRIPHRIIRHAVKNGDASIFVVVHEPFHHAPKIISVTRVDQGDPNLVGLRIESPGRVDTLLYALDRSRQVAAGGITMDGRVGLVSRWEKQPPRAYLVEGTRLKADGIDLTNNVAEYTGAVAAMERRWEGKGTNRVKVTPTQALPSGNALRGSWMIVKLGSWEATLSGEHNVKEQKQFESASQALEIDHVALEGGNTWVYVRGDYGLSMTDKGVEEFYWPRRTFTGPCSFRIATETTTHPLPVSPRPEPTVIPSLGTPPEGLHPGVKITAFAGTASDLKIQQQISQTLLKTADETALKKLIRSMQLPGAIRLEGFLQIPADGIYTIHFGASDEYRMTLGGVPVIETFRGRNLMPDTREVKLTKGWYPVTLECFRVENSRNPVWATTDWEGPGLPRQDFIPSLLTPQIAN